MELDSLADWHARGIDVLSESLTGVRSSLNLAGAVWTPDPLQAAFCWQPELMRRITRAISNTVFDVIQVEHLRGVRYGLGALAQNERLQKRIPVLWDSVDCISHLFEQTQQNSSQRSKRWITRFELERTRQFEAQMTTRFARTLIVSESERLAFCELPGALCERVSVVPNGVALDYFAPTDTVRDPATVLLTGKMSYHANVTAAEFLLDDIMPLVWQAVPTARVIIAGKDPPATLSARANERITITGYVPDLRVYLNRATVACAPLLYGAGIQNKVLEAMASGLPVVATPQALGALGAKPEVDVLAGQDANHLADQLVRVLTDGSLCQTLAHNGRQYVETHHSWSAVTRQLRGLYLESINSNRIMPQQ